VVEGVAHRPAHAAIREEGGADVPAEVEAHPLGRRHARVPLGEVAAGGLRGPLLGLEHHLVDLARLERKERRVGVFDDAEADPGEVGPLADLLPADGAPVLPAAEHDLLPALPGDDLVGAAAHRLLLELDVLRAVLERGVGLPGLFVDVPRQHGEVDVPDVGGERLTVEEDERAVVVGVHAPHLVGATADRRHRHPRVHDQPVGEGHVVGGDRRAVAPHEIVAEHDLVEQPVGARLPALHRLGAGEGLEVAAEGEQAEAGEPEHVELRRRADHDRVGAAEVAGHVAVDAGLGIGLVAVGQLAERGEDPGVGRGRVVEEREGLRHGAGGRRGGLRLPQQDEAVAHRPVDPLGLGVEFVERRRFEGGLVAGRRGRRRHDGGRGLRLGHGGADRVGRRPAAAGHEEHRAGEQEHAADGGGRRSAARGGIVPATHACLVQRRRPPRCYGPGPRRVNRHRPR
jgi:hypothetical protein